MNLRPGKRILSSVLLALGLAAGLAAATPATPAKALTTEQLLEELQLRAFTYFWFEASPTTGLVRDRSQAGSPCSIAATGFGLTAITIGIDRGYVPRAAGRDRVLAALRTLWNGPQNTDATNVMGYKGFFYHFLDLETGYRAWSSELSSIDTALLMAGVLHAGEYFTEATAEEAEIRQLAQDLYDRVDWDWMRNGGPALLHGWKPESGFLPYAWWGYNEAMILYILALGSDTHPVPASSWGAWTAGYQWQTHYGQSYVNFPPLFGHQYSHCWVDFRGIRDDYMMTKGIDYFENSRRATIASREYCIANPFNRTDYSGLIWGLTASDDPGGYLAHGAPPAQNDNGTITPTAAASSIAFAPEIVIPTLHAMYDDYGSQLWGSYGFKDAFNPTVSWFASDWLGIDQGPILIMIENYLNDSVWNAFMQNTNVQQGLNAANFQTVTGVQTPAGEGAPTLLQNAPNPFIGVTFIRYRLHEPTPVKLAVYDLRGRQLVELVDRVQEAGDHVVPLDGSGLGAGVYFYRLTAGGEEQVKRCTILK